jgi:hypothetical protein
MAAVQMEAAEVVTRLEGAAARVEAAKAQEVEAQVVEAVALAVAVAEAAVVAGRARSVQTASLPA